MSQDQPTSIADQLAAALVAQSDHQRLMSEFQETARRTLEEQALSFQAQIAQLQTQQQPMTRPLQVMNERFTKSVERFVQYNGNPAELEGWKRNVERTVDHWQEHELLSDYQQVSFARGALSGQAEHWLYVQEDLATLLNRPAFCTLQELLAALEKEFGVKNKGEKAFRYLKTLQPTATDLDKYLAMFSVHVANTELTEELKVRFFKEGLHPAITLRMKNIMYQLKVPTLSDAKDAAHQALLECESEDPGSLSRYAVPSPYSTPHQHNTSPQFSPPSPKRPRETTLTGVSKKPAYDAKCNKCPFPNHFTEDCRTNMNLSCSNCDKPGHQAANCRKSKRILPKETNGTNFRS